MTLTDKIFNNKIIGVKDFEFNQRVADVFDDMVSRSVPFYDEIHRILLDLSNYIFDHTNEPTIYDLGCSTGTTLKILSSKLGEMGQSPNLIGVDNSAPMIEKAKEKLDGALGNVKVLHQDLMETEFNQQADLIIMNYTLQFVDPNKRDILLKKIFNALKPGGFFILSEKINTQKDCYQSLVTDLYYDFKKRNGYSELEISQKREALENVMKPTTPAQQISALENAGFKNSEMIFRWYNFASYLCQK